MPSNDVLEICIIASGEETSQQKQNSATRFGNFKFSLTNDVAADRRNRSWPIAVSGLASASVRSP
jgi:hypothetical protein